MADVVGLVYNPRVMASTKQQRNQQKNNFKRIEGGEEGGGNERIHSQANRQKWTKRKKW